MLQMHNNIKSWQLSGSTTPYLSESGINFCCYFKCIKYLKSSLTRTFHKSYPFESPSDCRLSKGRDLRDQEGTKQHISDLTIKHLLCSRHGAKNACTCIFIKTNLGGLLCFQDKKSTIFIKLQINKESNGNICSEKANIDSATKKNVTSAVYSLSPRM